MSPRTLVAVALALALGACGEEPEAAPIVSTGPPPSVTEQPSELIVNPHVRLRDRSAEERAREAEELGLAAGSADDPRRERSGGGGGGGGRSDDDIWNPQHADPPTRQELERFQRELAGEMDDAIDPEDDPCRQLAESMRATATANERATREPAPPLDPATRRRFEQMCGAMPPGFQRCMDRAYFRAHTAECERQMALAGQRGERRADRARARLAAIRRGDAPFPGAGDPDPGDDEVEEPAE